MADGSVLQVSVLARQRLALGVGSEVAYFTDTHAFIPGSVVRGALAAAWIAEHGPPAAGSSKAVEFRHLFDGHIRYGPLHVTGSSRVPVSAWLCKYPKDESCARQAADAAFEEAATCPACGGPMEQGKGQVLLPAGTGLDRITRTSIDPATAKAKDGELYAHAALPADTTLGGFIYGRDEWLEQPRSLRLGGRRTVGGAADYQAALAGHRAEEPWGGGPFLVIRLTGPAVFVDAAGRPRLDPDPDLDLGGLQVTEAWARPVTWSGWHAASRLPKPEEICATAGSTYRISGPEGDLRALAERLPREGAGLRRVEGFGDIHIVMAPWRPPAAETPEATGASTDNAIREWHQRIQAFGLDPRQLRWVVGALRALQLDREFPASDTTARKSFADEWLERPAAEEFSGRQRDQLRELFAVPDQQVLRDLTTVLLADLPAAAAAGEEAR